jgi:hypothetical protein
LRSCLAINNARSSLTFGTIFSGVPKGAIIASQPADRKFGIVSAAVSRSEGAHGQRLKPAGLHGAE